MYIFLQNPEQDARQTSLDATMALVLMFKLDATAILIATTDLMKLTAVGFQLWPYCIYIHSATYCYNSRIKRMWTR